MTWQDGHARLVVDGQPQGDQVPMRWRIEGSTMQIDRKITAGPAETDGYAVIQFYQADGEELAWLEPVSMIVRLGSYVQVSPDINVYPASIAQ